MFLVAESETPEARDNRRAVTGRSSGETFADLLRALVPGAICELAQTVDAGPGAHPAHDLSAYDAIVLAGSPLHVYADTPEVRRQLEFMRAAYRSGTPSFGSCAGLQIAVAAAGGAVRRNEESHEVAVARRITPTAAGQEHPLMRGRPAAFDALAIHSDEVAALPAGSTLLATNRTTTVQAAEIRHDGGVFWGVQYHPEMPLSEIAGALRRQTKDMIAQGFAREERDVETYAALLATLEHEPERRDLAWRLGVDEQITDAALRQTEIRNFIEALVLPTRSRRGRG